MNNGNNKLNTFTLFNLTLFNDEINIKRNSHFLFGIRSRSIFSFNNCKGRKTRFTCMGRSKRNQSPTDSL